MYFFFTPRGKYMFTTYLPFAPSIEKKKRKKKNIYIFVYSTFLFKEININ